MTTIYDVPPNDLIGKAAEELKKIDAIQPPDWASFVKTGHFKDRPPAQDDWWYMRAAAVLRYIYTRKRPIGVAKLRTKYGGKKNRGHKPEHQYKGSGSILRKVLQQLTAAGFIEMKSKDSHKGRVLTPKGISFLDKIASDLYKSLGFNTKKPAEKEEKAEKPKHEAKPEPRPKQVEEKAAEGSESSEDKAAPEKTGKTEGSPAPSQ
ncbi:30S ribosomal protein S19e [Candidatus Woesearchaeota archaeon]|nr:30S ribosomal protein S19e [Candidatus Woesearchaeota archaeon]